MGKDTKDDSSSGDEVTGSVTWKQQNELLDRFKSLPIPLPTVPTSSISSSRRHALSRESSASLGERPHKRIRSLNGIALVAEGQDEDEWSRLRRKKDGENGNCLKLLGELMMKQKKERPRDKVKNRMGSLRRTSSEGKFDFYKSKGNELDEDKGSSALLNGHRFNKPYSRPSTLKEKNSNKSRNPTSTRLGRTGSTENSFSLSGTPLRVSSQTSRSEDCDGIQSPDNSVMAACEGVFPPSKPNPLDEFMDLIHDNLLDDDFLDHVG